MDMKTPEQIAERVIEGFESRDEYVVTESDLLIHVSYDFLKEMLAEAIEADRAQPRYELRHTLPSGQTINVWIGTSGADGSAIVQIDTADAEGNVRVFINDSDDPLLDENPETGRYEGLEPRERDACGDEVLTLSSDDLCDGCVEVGTQRCPNCGGMNRWPNLKEPITMCNSCVHNARRSGWEPGQ